MRNKSKNQKYYKFLTRDMTSFYDRSFKYEFGKWIKEENTDKSKEVCSVGLHLAKTLNPTLSYEGLCFEAIGRGKMAEDDETARFRSIKLIRIVPFSEIFYPKVNLQCASLSGADIREADLREANLKNSNMVETIFQRSNLKGANLEGANCLGADFSRANLEGANLEKAYLYGANLLEANLENANLTDIDLTNAILSGACFIGANIQGVHGIKHYLEGKPKLWSGEPHC